MVYQNKASLDEEVVLLGTSVTWSFLEDLHINPLSEKQLPAQSKLSPRVLMLRHDF